MKRIVEDKKIIVVGLGQTGLSCVRYLAAKGYQFSVMDSRWQPPMLDDFSVEYPDVDCHLGALDFQLLSQADELVVSPGVALEEPAIAQAMAAGVAVIGDIDLFRREVVNPIVAITGSNGKSTVTTLVGNMAREAGLEVAVGGNIGLPVLELLDENGNERESTELYVIELSSFQLERLSELSAEVATILNVSADHIDRYVDISSYKVAKQRIYRAARNVVINKADVDGEPFLPTSTKRIRFGLGEPGVGEFGLIAKQGRQFIAHGEELLLAVDELKLGGQHQLENALAALALGTAVQLPLHAMLTGLRKFKGLAHRCQYVATVGGVAFYNDSKGTNVGATMAAIEGLGASAKGKLVLIAGGEDKGAEFEPLHEVVKHYCKVVIVIGKAQKKLMQCFADVVPVEMAADLAKAVMIASQQAEPADIVLLSPACASFDMFESFEHRGQSFIDLVEALIKTRVESGKGADDA